MKFQREAISMFKEQVTLMALPEKKGDPVSEGVLGRMIRLLDTFSLLDNLKNSKASFNNDFAIYKRFDSLIL